MRLTFFGLGQHLSYYTVMAFAAFDLKFQMLFASKNVILKFIFAINEQKLQWNILFKWMRPKLRKVQHCVLLFFGPFPWVSAFWSSWHNSEKSPAKTISIALLKTQDKRQEKISEILCIFAINLKMTIICLLNRKCANPLLLLRQIYI